MRRRRGTGSDRGGPTAGGCGPKAGGVKIASAGGNIRSSGIWWVTEEENVTLASVPIISSGPAQAHSPLGPWEWFAGAFVPASSRWWE